MNWDFRKVVRKEEGLWFVSWGFVRRVGGWGLQIEVGEWIPHICCISVRNGLMVSCCCVLVD